MTAPANVVQPLYAFVRITENEAVDLENANGLGGFLCGASGLFFARVPDGPVIVDDLQVVAGQYYPMPFAIAGDIHVNLEDGASGTLAYVD